jgi:hypothetical protein
MELMGVRVRPLLVAAPNGCGFLARVIREEDVKRLRAHERAVRPLGEEAFLVGPISDLAALSIVSSAAPWRLVPSAALDSVSLAVHVLEKTIASGAAP